MSSSRAIVAAILNATACVALLAPDASAQTCSISSAARGPLSCSVTTTIHMSLRIPSIVGVTLTTPASPSHASNSIVRAGISVKNNRSYALQIASAPVDTAGGRVGSPQRVTIATSAGRASLDETPTQIDTNGGPSDDRDPIQLDVARDSQRVVSASDPIRLVLTIIAP